MMVRPRSGPGLAGPLILVIVTDNVSSPSARVSCRVVTVNVWKPSIENVNVIVTGTGV